MFDRQKSGGGSIQVVSGISTGTLGAVERAEVYVYSKVAHVRKVYNNEPQAID